MNVRVLWCAGLALALLGGCGGFDCSDTGKCPNDVSPTQTQVAQCDARTGDPYCGSQYKDYASCYLDNEQCDGAGNTDLNGTNAKCATQYAALLNCCAASPTSASCS